MTASSAEGWSTWWLEPRDPLVFGTGARVPALVPRHAGWLPPQPSLAGFVRSQFVSKLSQVSPEEARDLLEISLRGPWLVAAEEDGQRDGELWLPIPADAGLGASTGRWHRRRPLRPRKGEGVRWPSDAPSGLVPMALPVGEDHEKTRAPEFPFWPFERVLAWALEEEERSDASPPEDRPLPEYRIHVQLDDEAGTAAPEALFSSGGVRYPESFRLAVEVRDDRPSPSAPGVPAPGDRPVLTVLGAESRASRLAVEEGRCFPGFDAVRGRFESAIHRWERDKVPVGLRLELLTPGCFGGWQPRWPTDLELPLKSVALPPFTPVSGWNLQRRGPRPVRRLVPRGAVYLLGPARSGKEALELSARLWGRSLGELLAGEPAEHLAPPVRDGYGIVFSSPCPLPEEGS